MATQPIDWEPPRTARIYRLQPLKRREIEQFLFSQWAEESTENGATEEEYRQRVKEYLAEAADGEASTAALSVLGNPMDAAIAAELIARGTRPGPLRLMFYFMLPAMLGASADPGARTTSGCRGRSRQGRQHGDLYSG
jgi:hypothetical protein